MAEDRIDLSQEVEFPPPPKAEGKKEKVPTKAPSKAPTESATSKANRVPKNNKRGRSALDREASGTPESITLSKGGRPSRGAAGKENRETAAVVTTEVIDGTPQPEDEQMDLVDVQEAAAAAKGAAPEVYSREEEIEKLRTSGSMTQNQTEIHRVRNLSRMQMGEHEIEPWYFSPYPQEMTEADVVYICEFCLDYFGSYRQFTRHRSKCTLLHPPGNEIYRDDSISFFEIDGRRQPTYCRNLCLLSKLFLDHKTLYYDVDPFLFYIMCTRDSQGCHIVGYFSKEKESPEGYNVACILTLPQYQRKGFGRLLIAFSYELSKKEGKTGHPEKPLSDLGLLGYRAYWAEIVLEALLERSEASIDELASSAAMTTDDVIHTLQSLNMLRFRGNSHVIVVTEAALAHRERMREKEAKKGGKRVIDPDKLIWKPYTLTAAGRTWAW